VVSLPVPQLQKVPQCVAVRSQTTQLSGRDTQKEGEMKAWAIVVGDKTIQTWWTVKNVHEAEQLEIFTRKQDAQRVAKVWNDNDGRKHKVVGCEIKLLKK